MNEENKPKRGWVKNAIIVFLIIMLVLTFFSSTIMNSSLPEVAVQTVESGTISSQIRGTGTVSAVESYQVSIDETRTVNSVAVTLEQEVSPGDVLLTLSEADSSELETARTQLKSMQFEYEKALLGATNNDYARENRNIQKLTTQLEEAKAAQEELLVPDETYDSAVAALTDAKSKLSAAQVSETAAQVNLTKAQTNLDSAIQGGNGDYSAVTAARTALNEANSQLSEAKTALETAKLLYGSDYSTLEAEAKQWIIDDYNEANTPKEEPKEETTPDTGTTTPDEGGSEGGEGGEGGEQEPEPTPEPEPEPEPTPWEKLSESKQKSLTNEKLPSYLPAMAAKCQNEAGHEAHYTAYTEITAANRDVSSAQSAVNSAQSQYNAAYSAYSSANSDNTAYNTYKQIFEAANETYNTAKSNTEAAQTVVEEAQSAVDKLDAQKEQYKAAGDNVKTIEESIEDSLFDLSEQQKSDTASQKIESLNLREQRESLTEQEELVRKLETSGTGSNEVISQVYGTVKSIAISAGNTTDPGATLITIEVSDRGYQMEMTVTVDQARQVSVGDMAEISNTYWWGSQDINAQLVNIRTDPQSPQQNKILVFSVYGEDVEAGNSITLSMGAKSKSYEKVVPKSAIREDSNGQFVYMIVAKSSPVGNRYTAQRVDVQVVESDDTNSSITGALATGDYVITTSTAPIENGSYVRLPES